MSVTRTARWTSVGGLSLVLSALLLAQLSFDRWQQSTSSANIDFFTLWSVPRALARTDVADIYSPAGQLELGAALVREAGRPGTTRSQRTATAAIHQLYGGRVDATATPFAYTLVGLFSSGSYDRDLRRFVVLSWIAFAVSIAIVGSLLGLTPVAILLAFLVFTSSFAPVQADVRVANVNQLQLLGIAVFLWFTARARHWQAGIVLGLAIAFKPNVALILVFAAVVAMADRGVARRAGLFGGAALAVLAGVGLSGLYFGELGIWREFLTGLQRTTNVTYPIEIGNFGLPALVFALSGWKVSWLVGTALVAAFAFVVARTRARAAGAADARDDTGETGAPDRELHQTFVIAGAGCAVMLLASNLAWLHYYVLLIPLALYLLRPVPEAHPERGRCLACGAAAVLALLLFSSSVQYAVGAARPAAILVNVATGLLLLAAFDDLWRQRAPRSLARAPRTPRGSAPRPGLRSRRRALAHGG